MVDKKFSIHYNNQLYVYQSSISLTNALISDYTILSFSHSAQFGGFTVYDSSYV